MSSSTRPPTVKLRVSVADAKSSVTVSVAVCSPGVAKRCQTCSPCAVPPSSNDHS